MKGIVLVLCTLFIAFLPSNQGADWSTCTPLDSRCKYKCGDGICESLRGETPCLCAKDCRGCCEDGICRPDHGENHINCPRDCGASIKGQVIHAATKAPLSGVLVRCVSPSNPNTVFGPLFTGATGMFTFDRLPKGLYKCSAEISNQDPVFFESDLAPQNCTQKFNQIQYPFSTGNIIGHVLNCYTGENVVGAVVECSSPASTTFPRISDAMGRFFVDDVPPGSTSCSAKMDRFVSSSRVASVMPNKHSVLRIYICPRLANLTGVVTDCKNATRVRNAIVECKVMMAPSFFSTVSSKTDANGSYSLTGLPPGPTVCTFSAPTYRSTMMSVHLSPDTSTIFHQQICEPVFKLEGIVREFTICHARGICNVLVTCQGAHDYGQTLTHSDGSFSMMLKQGTYACYVQKAGYVSDFGWTAEVGPSCMLPTLKINMNPVFGSVGGRVHARFYPAIPVSGATITCYFNPRHLDGSPDWEDDRCAPRIRMTTSDANGNWLIPENQRNGPVVCHAELANSIYDKTSVRGETVPGGFFKLDIPMAFRTESGPPKLSSQP